MEIQSIQIPGRRRRILALCSQQFDNCSQEVLIATQQEQNFRCNSLANSNHSNQNGTFYFLKINTNLWFGCLQKNSYLPLRITFRYSIITRMVHNFFKKVLYIWIFILQYGKVEVGRKIPYLGDSANQTTHFSHYNTEQHVAHLDIFVL